MSFEIRRVNERVEQTSWTIHSMNLSECSWVGFGIQNQIFWCFVCGWIGNPNGWVYRIRTWPISSLISWDPVGLEKGGQSVKSTQGQLPGWTNVVVVVVGTKVGDSTWRVCIAKGSGDLSFDKKDEETGHWDQEDDRRQLRIEKNKKLIDKKNRNRNAVRMRTRIITRGKRLRRGRGRKEYGDKHLRNEKEEF